MENAYQIITCLLLGIGLSATCGFKVFVPLLGISIAANAGWLELSPSFDWLGSTPAVLLLGVATALEICAYYIPFVDNLLDTIAVPASAIAGAIVVGSTMVADMSPILKWAVAIIAGAAPAAAVKTTTAAVRGISSATTAGLGNFAVNTGETVCSIVCCVLTLLLPLLGILLIAWIVVLIVRMIRRLRKRLAKQDVPPVPNGNA